MTFGKVVEDKNIDISCRIANGRHHWPALMATLGVQNGRTFYGQKPGRNNLE